MWKGFYNSFCGYVDGQRALSAAARQNRWAKYFTFPNFEKSAENCRQEMERVGLSDVRLEQFPADGETTWSGWRAMKAWDVTEARLTLTHPHQKVLTDWTTLPESLVMYSGPCSVEGELVEWNGENTDQLKGKIPFTRLRLMDVYPQMRGLGINGIVSDFIGTLPGVRDRYDIPDAVRWENYVFKNSGGNHWGFMLTPRQGRMLRDLMHNGPVRLQAEIKTRVYDGVMSSVSGLIRGTDLEDEEILLISHLYEPGANDNASGVGLSLEIARSLIAAIEDGVIPRPRRSIRFLFGWEGFGLMARVQKHRGRLANILAGLNIDELGVNQSKGHSILHLFMPPAANNSCVGSFAEHLCEGLLTPSLRWKSVADRPEIINDAITADPNIDLVMPTLIQYPSRFYHTSADRMETLGPDTMELLGTLSAVYLYCLADAGRESLDYLSRLVVASLQKRMTAIELRLLESSWPFCWEVTEIWLLTLLSGSIRSLEKFGLDRSLKESLQREVQAAVAGWCGRWKTFFPEKIIRKQSKVLQRAVKLILSRTTMGMTMPPEIKLEAEESRKFLDILYSHNLDLVFLRIAYWADGKRNLLEIIELLELEIDELYRDTSIARTGSGSLIEIKSGVELDLEAVLYVVDVITRSGLLKSV
ncbi:MAG TPA: DUF4910 domain-containing protein [bacterium]|nr:DUF4910 domain-containing protein [bacterium]